MKKLFSTPKRTIISVICLVAAVAAVSVMIVKNTLITKAQAKAAALTDAGLNEAEVSALRARLDFDDGRFQYEVDFYNNGVEYEYLIQAKDGDIIARDIDGGTYFGQNLPLDTNNQSAANENNYVQSQENTGTQPIANENSSVQSQENVGNQPAADGNNSVQSQENAGTQPAADGNSSVQSQGNTGTQPAADGNSSMQSQRNTGTQPAANGNNSTQSQLISLDEAKAAALSDAGLSESNVTFKKTELDYDNGIQIYDIEFYTSDTEYDYEVNASNKAILEKSIEPFYIQGNQTINTANNTNNNYIGVDRAKQIALNHAKLSEADVQFAKAKLENDDGKVEYEIEFYYGRSEYDYTIDAISGNINEYDVDYN